MPDLYVLQNQKRFNFNDFSRDGKVIEESNLFSVHLNLLQASTIEGVIQLVEAEDEISYL